MIGQRVYEPTEEVEDRDHITPDAYALNRDGPINNNPMETISEGDHLPERFDSKSSKEEIPDRFSS